MGSTKFAAFAALSLACTSGGGGGFADADADADADTDADSDADTDSDTGEGATFALYLPRDGGEYATGPDDARVNRASAASGTAPAWAYGDAAWNELLGCVRDLFSPFAIDVTDVEPPADEPYIEAVTTGSNTDFGFAEGYQGIGPAGCAPLTWAVVFAFTTGDPEWTCHTTAQVTGTALGLDHVVPCEDGMSIDRCGEKTFRDTESECGDFTARPCACGGETQNSHQALLEVLGARKD
jgi:hypothetical protein